MTLNPREIHAIEQFGALLREVARALAAYREELVASGMDPAEAFALVQRLEERLLSEGFDIAEHALKRNDLDGTPPDAVR